MAPRSSISKRGLRLTNGVGAIDPTYRGNLRARFDVHESYSGTKPGDALLQVLTPDGGGANLIVVGPDAPPSVLALFDTASTERGAGAFGSTGASGTTGEMSGAGGAGGSP
jgi:dUTP pyrophosphatase